MSTLDAARLSAIDRSLLWVPQRGPQMLGYLSKADQLLYGGAAGGGKTQLAIGLALMRHTRTLFLRYEGKQLLAVLDEVAKIRGTRDGYNGQTNVWRLEGEQQIQFGGLKNLGDETGYQGNPHDLIVFDEAANLRESQVQFLLGWLRTTDPDQRCRVLLCSNPPTAAEGEWLIRWFAPWLDKRFPKPAMPGELRWVVMIPGSGPGSGERWVEGPEPFQHGVKPDGTPQVLHPRSRTFIPSRVGDNAYLVGTDYEHQLQALPEPLRSQMLYGDFTAGRADDDWQVIPTAWIDDAMSRWKPKKEGMISSIGVDPSRGGDETTIAIRRGWDFDEIVTVPPTVAKTGAGIAKRVLDVAGDAAPIHVDVIGVGASTVDFLAAWAGKRVRPINNALPSEEKDLTGHLRFANVRAANYWRMRDRLSPEAQPKVSLPPDGRLKSDLASAHYKLRANGIQVESKDEIKARLGRSPDRGDAVILAAMRTPLMLDNGK